jgi:hypothetical protein
MEYIIGTFSFVLKISIFIISFLLLKKIINFKYYLFTKKEVILEIIFLIVILFILSLNFNSYFYDIISSHVNYDKTKFDLYFSANGKSNIEYVIEIFTIFLFIPIISLLVKENIFNRN